MACPNDGGVGCQNESPISGPLRVCKACDCARAAHSGPEAGNTAVPASENHVASVSERHLSERISACGMDRRGYGRVMYEPIDKPAPVSYMCPSTDVIHAAVTDWPLQSPKPARVNFITFNIQ
jgi:hypothetical protein